MLVVSGSVFASEAHLQWEPLGEPGSGGAITSIAVYPKNPRRILVGGDMLGIGVSDDGGDGWRSGLALPSYEIADFTFHPSDPQVVWVGTMSGPCVSRDGGWHWQSKRMGFPPISWGKYSAPVQKILFDPQNRKRLIALGGNRRRWREPDGTGVWAVWESCDDGERWTEISRINGTADVMSAMTVPSPGSQGFRIFVALHNQGIWQSADGGFTWQARNQGLPDLEICGLSGDQSGHGRIWAAVGDPHGDFHGKGGLYYSGDEGDHWLRANLPGYDCAAVSVCASAPSIILASVKSWKGGTLFRSEDDGSTWRVCLDNTSFKRAYRAGAQMSVVEVAPGADAIMFAGNTETVTRSTDGGKSWEDVTSALGRDGSWHGRGYSGLCTLRFRFNPEQQGHSALVAMDNGNFWQSRDGCSNWTWGGGEHFPGWGKVQDVAFAGDHGMSLYLALEPCDIGVCAKTCDGGRHWESCPNHGLPTETMITVCARPDSPKLVWAASRSGKIYSSKDGGDHWTMALDAGITALALPRRDDRSIVAGGKEGLYLAPDGEHFIHDISSPREIVAMSVVSESPLQAAIVTKGGIWKIDRDRWTMVEKKDLIADIAMDPDHPQRIAFATNDDPYHDQTRASGVWISDDGGSTWRQECDGLPVLRGGVLALDPFDSTRLVFGSNGRGYFVARWIH